MLLVLLEGLLEELLRNVGHYVGMNPGNEVIGYLVLGGMRNS